MTSIGKDRTSRGSLIDAYLTDLERALVRLDVADREEVFANIVEHIDGQRSADASTKSDAELLGQLGSVDDIARSAAEGEVNPSTRTFDAPQKHNDDLPLLIVSVTALVLCLFIPPVGFLLAIGESAVLVRSRKKAAPSSSLRKTAVVLNIIGIVLAAIMLLGSFMTLSTTSTEETNPTPSTPVEQNVPTNP